MKEIFVRDAVEACMDCQFCRELDEGIEACCELMSDPNDTSLCRNIDDEYCQEKPDWCPFKPLLEKDKRIDICLNKQYVCGWNACIDTVIKEWNAAREQFLDEYKKKPEEN